MKLRISILSKYVFISLLKGIGVMFLLFVCLFFLIGMITEFSSIGVNKYGLLQAFGYVFMKMPNEICLFAPFVTLLGCVLSLGSLSRNNEVVIMVNSLFSIKKIGMVVLWAGVLISIVVVCLSEFIAPPLLHLANNYKLNLISGGKYIRNQQGFWFRDEHSYVHVNSINKIGDFFKVTKYDVDDDFNLIKASFAERAFVKDGKWFVKNVKNSIIYPNKIITKNEVSAVWELPDDVFSSYVLNMSPEEMNLKQLYAYMQEQIENNVISGEVSLSFWKRMFRPLVIILMMFLAVPIVLGYLHVIRSTSIRVIVGMLVGFVFYFINTVLTSVSAVYALSPVFLSLAPIVLFSMITYILINKLH